MDDLRDIQNLHKRKSRRRSSMATNDLLKLFSRNENMNETDLLQAVANLQFNWINGLLNELTSHEKRSNKLVSSTCNILKSVSSLNQKIDDEHKNKFSNVSIQEQLEMLTDKQREFLRNHQLNEEFILNHLQKMKIFYIESEIKKVSQKEANDYLKKTFLNRKSSSRSSFGGGGIMMSCGGDRSNHLSPEEILIDYFTN